MYFQKSTGSFVSVKCQMIGYLNLQYPQASNSENIKAIKSFMVFYFTHFLLNGSIGKIKLKDILERNSWEKCQFYYPFRLWIFAYKTNVNKQICTYIQAWLLFIFFYNIINNFTTFEPPWQIFAGVTKNQQWCCINLSNENKISILFI